MFIIFYKIISRNSFSHHFYYFLLDILCLWKAECLDCPEHSVQFPHSWERILRVEGADWCGGAALRAALWASTPAAVGVGRSVGGWVSSSQAEPAGLLRISCDTGTSGGLAPQGGVTSSAPPSAGLTGTPVFNLEHTAINTCD